MFLFSGYWIHTIPHQRLTPVLHFLDYLCSATVYTGVLCGPFRPLQHGLFPGAEERDGLQPGWGFGSGGDAMQLVLYFLCLCEGLASGNL